MRAPHNYWIEDLRNSVEVFSEVSNLREVRDLDAARLAYDQGTQPTDDL